MENFFINHPEETVYEPSAPLSIEAKIQKLINMCSAYKEKYDFLKEDYEKMMSINSELRQEKSQLENRIIQLNEDLQSKVSEIDKLKDLGTELDHLTKTAVSKIDLLISECEFDI